MDIFILLQISPVSSLPLIPQARSGSHIISINQIHPLLSKLSPNPIPSTNRPTRLIPIPKHNPFTMRSLHLRSKQSQLRLVQAGSEHGTKVGSEVGGGDG
jgi:hypothetical protein